jgi:hypothetical protein
MATIDVSNPIVAGDLPAGVWETFRHPASPDRRRMPKRLAAQAVRVSADGGAVYVHSARAAAGAVPQPRQQ